MTDEHVPTGDEVAAIDCGTNSIRLLIARPGPDGAGLQQLHREMRVVRLGQGVDATGEFSAAALQRTFDAVDDYAVVIRRLLGTEDLTADRVRFVATSASRDVSNRDAFVEGIRSRLGVTPDVVDGLEEAGLSFAGAAGALPVELRRRLGRDRDAIRVLVVDLGGGSTEFVLGTLSLSDLGESSVLDAVSKDMGCVRFTERYLHSDPPSVAEITGAQDDVNAVLDEVAERIDLTRVEAVVGVAGTVTTVTAAALGLEAYDPDALHGAVVDLPTIDAAAATLLTSTRDQRADLPFMHPGRVDVIGAGSLIWTRILSRLHAETQGRVGAAVTSEHDILDGIALSLLGERS